MSRILSILLLGAALVLPATVQAAVFNISLFGGGLTGGGTIVIDDSFISPNAVVTTGNVTVSFDFAGFNFSTPLNPINETFIFDASGQEIIAANDLIGSSVDFRDTLGSFTFISFLDGGVPGVFRTVGLQENIIGKFDITRVSAVPLPAALPLFAGGIGLFALMSRRRKKQAA